jgi:ferredoxin
MTTRPTRLRIDPIACEGRGLCADLLPELIQLDEWGYPLVRPGAMPPQLRKDAQSAARHCPTLALRVVNE